MSQPNETDLFRQAEREGRTVEEIKRDFQEAQGDGRVKKFGLPVMLRSGGVAVRGRDAQIAVPTAEDISTYVDNAPRHVCGDCKFFDLEKGRKEIIRQRFGEKLVKELDWGLRHLGGPIDNVGLCGASGGTRACLVITPADKCDQFRLK